MAAPSSVARRRKGALGTASAVIWCLSPGLFVACGDSSPGTRERPGAERSAPGRPDVVALIQRAKSQSAQGLDVEAAQLLDGHRDELSDEERRQLDPLIAEYYHRGGVFDKALESVERARAAGDQSASTLFIQGDSLRAQRRWTEARSRLEELLQKHPQHRRGKLALARVLVRVGDPRDALPLFEDCFAASPATGSSGPPDRAASLDYGRALRAVKDYRRAADCFAVLLIANPFDAVAYSELAQTFYRRRMRQEGKFIEQIYKAISQNAFEEYVEQRLRASGMTSFALGQKAINQVRQKRFLLAFRNYRAALRVDKSDARLSIFYAGLCRRFRRATEASRVLEEALAAGAAPASGLWMTRAMIEFDREDSPAALESARAGLAALESEGDLGGVEKGQGVSLKLLLGVARGALETGELEAAESALERAAARHPSAWEPAYWRGRVELTRGRLDPAAAAFSRARAKGAGNSVDLVYWTAVLLEREGDSRAAAESLEKVLQMQPGHRRAYELFSEILATTGDERLSTLQRTHGHVPSTVRRIEELEEVIDRRPLEEVGLSYLELGELYRKLRDPIAFDFFFLVSELLPRNVEALQQLLSGMTRPQDVFVRLQCLHRLLEIEPDLPQALAEISSIYIRLNVRLEVARALAERLHQTATSEVSYRLLGELELRAGNREAGLHWLNEGLRKYPDDPRLREALEKSGQG